MILRDLRGAVCQHAAELRVGKFWTRGSLWLQDSLFIANCTSFY